MSSRKIASLIPSQTGKCVSHSIPTDMSINWSLLKCCWAFFFRSAALQNHHKVSLFGSNSVGISSRRSFWDWSLCWLADFFLCWVQIDFRLEPWPPFFGSWVAYLSETFPDPRAETGNCILLSEGCFYNITHSDFSKTSSRQVQGLMFRSPNLLSF